MYGLVKTIIPVAVPHERYRGSDPAASIYRASFTKVLFTNLNGIALSNILIFTLDVSPAFYGIANALSAFAYFAGPSLFHGVSQKAGIKRSLQILTVIGLAVLLLVAIFPVPLVVIIAFIIDGFTACMFWANMAAAVNTWQQASPMNTHETIYRRYGLSWIAGGMVSELIGLCIITLGFDDRVVLLSSISIAVFQVPLIWHLSIPVPHSKAHKPSPITPPKHRASILKRLARARIKVLGQLLLAPVTLMVVAEITIQMVRGTYDFLFPFIVRDDGGSTVWIYFVSLVQRLAFMVGMHVSTKQGQRAQHYSATMSIGVTALLTVHVIAAPGAAIFCLALAITSMTTGMLYGYSSHVLLCYAKEGAALKITAFYEAISGAGYGIILVITSLCGENDTKMVFTSLEWVLAIGFFLFAVSSIKGRPGMHRGRSEREFDKSYIEFLGWQRASALLFGDIPLSSLASSPLILPHVENATPKVDTAKK